MSEKKKVLIVTQEMEPYTAANDVATIARQLGPYLQSNDMEIRVLMPRFGTINERRHRLHEVVRLSGMNIIVDDDDYPLIIKVATLQEARMQVYFLDNDDFFRRKHIFTDADDKPFEDNADRMAFFCKGVIETVKKFGWPPDIIHCHGWMTSLIPFYLKTAYKSEPLFQNSHVIYSAYQNDIEPSIGGQFAQKASINNLEADDLSAYLDGDRAVLNQGGMRYADAIIQGSAELNEADAALLATFDKPVLNVGGQEDYLEKHLEFYQTLTTEEV